MALSESESSKIFRIFVVHGHSLRKYELLHLLEKAVVNGDVIVLDEKTNRGATILEKFERHAQEVDFAVVLLTGDDEGRLRGSDDQPSRLGVPRCTAPGSAGDLRQTALLLGRMPTALIGMTRRWPRYVAI
jgi:predicted nucleotide-binding protein